jgi:1-acyl-sn-glycerol-3-phosphate acyltransferase
MDARTVLLPLFRRIARIYFREIEVVGDVPPASTGGRLFAANHVNGLVDPILVLTQAPCVISPIAKSTLWQIPGLRWLLDGARAVPIVRRRDVPGKSEGDNDATFARVSAHLRDGGNILIFPEGTSHNEPHLLALRSGAGRMLARAFEEPRPALDLTFQAVGLEFDERDVFRSRALVVFGPVRRVSDLPRAELATHVTETLRNDLSELLVEGATWNERLLVVRVAEMFANDAADGSLERRNEVGRRIELARHILERSAPDRVAAIEARVSRYIDALTSEGVSDGDVARFTERAPLDSERLERSAALLATLPLALVGSVLYWLPYQLPRFVTQRLRGEPDVASTYKLGVGLVVFPLWALLASTVALATLPWLYAVLAIVIVCASPFSALAWLDRWDRLARTSRFGPSPERRQRVRDLAAERSDLMRALDALREEAGV